MRVAIIYGGKSAEHDVSVLSARNIYNAIDRDKYSPVFIKILRNGIWTLVSNAQFLSESAGVHAVEMAGNHAITLAPECCGELHALVTPRIMSTVDVAFPVLHGPMGEDGTVQGLLKLANIPFVGSSVLGSALGMDKDVMKRLLRDAGIPIGAFMVLRDGKSVPSFKEVTETLGLPFFVKPANMGSSLGVTKVDTEPEFLKSVEVAFSYDVKIVLEAYIEGREIECSLIGNEEVRASVLGEIKAHDVFYSYSAKYQTDTDTVLEIPASVSEDIAQRARDLACQSYTTLMAEGLARVDMFLTKAGDILINEINTMPGFTQNSMFPKLWEASGMSYTQLIDTLIHLAITRHHKEQKLKTGHTTSTYQSLEK